MRDAVAPSDRQEVLTRLDALVAIQLRLAHLLSGKDPKREIGADAVFLRGFGFRNADIALILGSTPGSIAELVSRSQRSAKGRSDAKARAK